MKRWQIAVVALILLSGGWFPPGLSRAERTRPIRIGALTTSWGITPGIAGLRDGLIELGYRENVDFFLGVRFTRGDLTALPAAAREIVQYGVDLIFVSGDPELKEVHQATTQIPIVFTNVSDPVELGLIESFAYPGGNITGVSSLARDMGAKRLEMFLELLPSLKRIGFLYDTNDVYTKAQTRMYRDAARRLGVELIEKAVQTATEVQTFLNMIRTTGIDGILAPRCCSLNIPGFILKATIEQKIPAMFEAAFWVDQGGLVSYGADYHASGKHAARLADKILKGAKPAALPVEVNPTIELAINLKRAKKLGLIIPPEVLYQADRLIR